MPEPAKVAYTPNVLDGIYNAFDPFQPLQAGSPQYVECREERGDADIWRDVGKKILRSQTPICQLYAGHRGGGKSTELLQLKQKLEEKGCYVVYFAADEGDIDPEDAQYTDILLACTRHLLKELRGADSLPIANWLGDRWQDLKDLALMEVNLEDLKFSVEQQIAVFGKLTASVRAVPSQRQKIREKLDPHTVTLLQALNEFLDDAKKKLPNGKAQLVVIADNLDRIVPVPAGDRTNHDEIFLDRAEQLRGLSCHVIYTVPISMVYSSRANDLRDLYGDINVLPMIMVRARAGELYAPGLAKMQEILQKRMQLFVPTRELDGDVFESAALSRLLEKSGGHLRNLMLLVQSAIDYLDDLPITLKAIQRAIAKAREQMRLTPEASEWALLRQVAKTHQIPNKDDYRRLLFNRCILQYCEADADGNPQAWYDVHPLLKETSEFQADDDNAS